MAAEKPDEPRDTEQTPKGLTVPVPKREDFFANLEKVAKSDKPGDDRDGPKPKGAEDVYGETWIDRS